MGKVFHFSLYFWLFFNCQVRLVSSASTMEKAQNALWNREFSTESPENEKIVDDSSDSEENSRRVATKVNAHIDPKFFQQIGQFLSGNDEPAETTTAATTATAESEAKPKGRLGLILEKFITALRNYQKSRADLVETETEDDTFDFQADVNIDSRGASSEKPEDCSKDLINELKRLIKKYDPEPKTTTVAPVPEIDYSELMRVFRIALRKYKEQQAAKTVATTTTTEAPKNEETGNEDTDELIKKLISALRKHRSNENFVHTPKHQTKHRPMPESFHLPKMPDKSFAFKGVVEHAPKPKPTIDHKMTTVPKPHMNMFGKKPGTFRFSGKFQHTPGSQHSQVKPHHSNKMNLGRIFRQLREMILNLNSTLKTTLVPDTKSTVGLINTNLVNLVRNLNETLGFHSSIQKTEPDFKPLMKPLGFLVRELKGIFGNYHLKPHHRASGYRPRPKMPKKDPSYSELYHLMIQLNATILKNELEKPKKPQMEYSEIFEMIRSLNDTLQKYISHSQKSSENKESKTFSSFDKMVDMLIKTLVNYNLDEEKTDHSKIESLIKELKDLFCNVSLDGDENAEENTDLEGDFDFESEFSALLEEIKAALLKYQLESEEDFKETLKKHLGGKPETSKEQQAMMNGLKGIVEAVVTGSNKVGKSGKLEISNVKASSSASHKWQKPGHSKGHAESKASSEWNSHGSSSNTHAESKSHFGASKASAESSSTMHHGLESKASADSSLESHHGSHHASASSEASSKTHHTGGQSKASADSSLEAHHGFHHATASSKASSKSQHFGGDSKASASSQAELKKLVELWDSSKSEIGSHKTPKLKGGSKKFSTPSSKTHGGEPKASHDSSSDSHHGSHQASASSEASSKTKHGSSKSKSSSETSSKSHHGMWEHHAETKSSSETSGKHGESKSSAESKVDIESKAHHGSEVQADSKTDAELSGKDGGSKASADASASANLQGSNSKASSDASSSSHSSGSDSKASAESSAETVSSSGGVSSAKSSAKSSSSASNGKSLSQNLQAIANAKIIPPGIGEEEEKEKRGYSKIH